MDPWLLSFLESALYIGTFLAAIYFLIPRSIKFWRKWKESGNLICLSNAIAFGVTALFLLTADFLMFIRAVGGYTETT